MGMKLQYLTSLLAAGAAAVAIASDRRRSQQLSSPATGAARELCACRPATFRSRLPQPMFSTTAPGTCPI